MEKIGFGYSGVWNISPDISLENVFFSVYHWDQIQVVLCSVVYF